MAIPDPFNSVADLVKFTSFVQGAGNGQQSVIEGTFEYSQFTDALICARNEIYARCGQKQNDDYDDYRLGQLTEAELWLATARLYRNYGEKMVLKFPESNLAGVGSVTIGADTPNPLEKSQHWIGFMIQHIRGFGVELMLGQGNCFDMEVGTDTSTNTNFLGIYTGNSLRYYEDSTWG